MKHQKEKIPSKLSSYIIWGIIAVALLALNYWYLDKYLSFNSSYITAYRPGGDDLAQYRNPAVAGVFYAEKSSALSKQVDEYLQAGQFIRYVGNMPKIIVVPHAGYAYSAGTAAKAYVILQRYASTIKNVILLGPSHHTSQKGIFLSGADYFTTPLGNIPVNKEIAHKMERASKLVKVDDKIHAREHSIEVQLPFIQKVLPEAHIIPLVYGDVLPEDIANLLQKYINMPDTVLVVSADLSHYHDYDEANRIDAETAEKIAEGEALDSEESCGAPGINAVLLMAQNSHYKPQMLELINSGDSSGHKSRVVGYGAWSFYPDSTPRKSPNRLTQEVKNLKAYVELYGKNLLEIADISLQKAVHGGKRFSPSRRSYPERLFDKGAAFVTLKQDGILRGCIGSVLPTSSVAQNVASNMYAAALEDSRFSPVTETDLPTLNHTISLLTGVEKISYVEEKDALDKIREGIDGVVIRDGNRQGVFLPSVWEEIPDKNNFFKQLKIKAGMNPNYWNNSIKVYRFRTVEIKNEH